MPLYHAPLLCIDKNETKRYAGLGHSEFDDRMIEKACMEAQLFSHVQGSWNIYPYNAQQGMINSVPQYRIDGIKIRKHLQNAQQVIVLSVTLGAEIEEMVAKYFHDGDFAFSLLLDAAATAAVETAADAMEKTIQQSIHAKGCHTITRFSPGYGDWDIKFQPHMLELAKAETIDVRLTESYMLIPRKSITAIIGVVPNQTLKANRKSQSCVNCNQINCLARKELHQ